ncbi:MAG: class I SAM-dependent methyltransferase [Chloroflexi bacterium]|nr:class I SAM-dependent methyltransferase [Chloroflexota bacterium]MCI0649702.1 class I SAM-dependent methyltransferase [Chloroflexota bacterium]MCI0725432.1 class I SAM-dependent methyltransferase [Chloroflexota bacterium]
MEPKPIFWQPDHASAFEEQSVVAAYRFRPPYPAATFPLLAELATQRRRLLDVGCGTGFLARPLAAIFEQVDAIDISPAMIREAKRLPNGDAPNLSWITGRVEDIPLQPPYDMITAGDSLHWLAWETALPRFADLLTADGYLVVLTIRSLPTPWDGRLLPIVQRYSTNQAYRPVELIDELVKRQLFDLYGLAQTLPEPFTQSVGDYVESFHGRASFSRERMPAAAAKEFDNAIQVLLREDNRDAVTLSVTARIAWGKPLHNPKSKI